MPFQTLVNLTPAPGVPGDFASANPRAVTLAGPGGFAAGPGGVYVGRFAWYDTATATLVTNTGLGIPNGFVGNHHNAIITTYLAETGLLIPQGFGLVLWDSGDFWVTNSGTTPAVPGMKAYANNASGLVSFAATGAPSTGGSGGATSSIAAGSGSVTASIAVVPGAIGPGTNPGIMTVTAVGSGSIQIGGLLSGTGVAAGQTVVSQLTGTPNGVGTYQVSVPQNLASTTITEAYGVLTIAGTTTGTFAVGQTLQATGSVVAGTQITALGTGTGGNGTYIVNNATVVAAQSILSYGNVETVFYCRSFGQAGELVKMSSRAMG